MESPSIFRQNKNPHSGVLARKHAAGFTLIEILIAIGILAIIFSLGLFISLDFFKSFSFNKERDVIVTILQKARSQSLNNINEKRHGVHFFIGANNTLTYLIFECGAACTTYSGANSTDVPISASASASITNPKLPFDIIFEQLSGNCVATSGANPFAYQDSQPIIVSDGKKSYNITINSEGRINW